jgi:hypothetical protein
MRIAEIIREDIGQDINHNDKADAHGYNDIMNALVTVQAELAFQHAIPREEAAKIVAMVNAQRGDNSFRWTDLNDAIKSGQFKDVVEKVEPDERTGVNYIYFVTPDTQVSTDTNTDAGGGTGGNMNGADSQKTVSAMAKRAAGK